MSSHWQKQIVVLLVVVTVGWIPSAGLARQDSELLPDDRRVLKTPRSPQRPQQLQSPQEPRRPLQRPSFKRYDGDNRDYQQRLEQHRHKIERHYRRPDYGRVVTTLPRGYRRPVSRHHDFFYFGGTFYRHHDGGYRIDRPPYGLIVASLPLGYWTVQVGTEFYACYNDVYYRPVAQGYMVVEAPAAVPPPQPDRSATPANALGTVTVAVKVLNVRSGPSRLHPVTEHVYEGDALHVLGQAPDWYYVQLPQGGFGWVWAEFSRGTLTR